MLVLKQKKSGNAAKAEKDSIVLGFIALGISIPFGILSGHFLDSALAGAVLGAALCTYSILLAQLMKNQGAPFLKMFWKKESRLVPYSINEVTGLELDLVGAKDPQDRLDGIVHKRNGEIQRFLRCSLPQRSSDSSLAVLFELLFAYLSSFQSARFQLVFPAVSRERKRDFILVVSYKNRQACTGKKKSSKGPRDETPPLEQLNGLIDQLIERLITLSVEPRLMSAVEVRALYSEEFGSHAGKLQDMRDWKHVGNLGWEPIFRNSVIIPSERCVQIGQRRACTIQIDQLLGSDSLEWLSSFLNDMPGAHASIFLTAYPDKRIQLNQSMPLTHTEATHSKQSQAAGTAQMSFHFRFEGRDAYSVESELTTAVKYLSRFNISSSFSTQKYQQTLQWRATLPGAKEQKTVGSRLLIAFMPIRSADSNKQSSH